MKEDKSNLERHALLSAVRNTTLPRLVAADVPTVKIILWDLFHLPDGESLSETRTKLNVSPIQHSTHTGAGHAVVCALQLVIGSS